jgi:hypothetical protein
MSILEEVSKMSAEEQMAMAVALQNAASQKVSQARSENIGKSVEVVIQGLKKIKTDLEARFDELNGTIQSKANSLSNGKDGKDGRNGKDGAPGRDGKDGATGPVGANGADGADGTDGVSVSNAFIDFDGSLTIVLSNGTEINAGEVVPMDVAEKIKVITNGGGTSQSVLDSIASLQAQITALIPSQTGNSGKYLTTNGSVLSWATVTGVLSYQGTWNASANTPTLASSTGTQGYYYIVGTSGSTNLNGITDWVIGDWLLFNGSVWQKIDTTDLVTSVAGRTGAVTLSTTDISGLGTIATQAASSVAITGGSITGITDLAVADGGTGSSTASGARTNLGLVIGTDVLAPTGSAASLTSFPTFNQNTTGTASNVTGTVAVANGGTGLTAAPTNGQIDIGSTGVGFVRTTLTAGTGISVSNTAGAITIASSVTPVTSVTGTSPVASSGGVTPAISLAASYGDTQNPYASKTANYVLAAPNGSAGAPTFRAIVAADIPTLNQNTSGTAAGLSATLAIASGGSGTTTAQLAMNAFAGAVTSGSYLRGNGTNVVMNTIQAVDVPTLNQSTTGSAGSLATTNFSIVESGGKLLFKYGATTIASMTSAGVITALSNISANNTP